MILRRATSGDKSAIVELLKKSLGESLLKKSTEIWDYKHNANPFGKSYVLIAEENSEIIGVRAFMSWKWQVGSKTYQAYRAVDTATHPDHQGKGVFKKLTLSALEEVGKNQDCFIFNTPNDQSRPGYLKMGWESLGKISIAVLPSLASGLFSNRSFQEPITDKQLDQLCSNHNDILKKSGKIFTPKSRDYLNWRYANNPMQSYQIITGKNWYVAAYVKKHRYLSEFRLAEVIGSENYSAKKEIKAVVKQLALEHKCMLVTTTNKALFSLRYFGPIGPILTCRDLTANKVIMEKSKQPYSWAYSMGDLELF